MAGDQDAHDEVLMVIPSIEGGALLARMLPTVRHRPSQVVVLDQGSVDETAAVCAAAGVELMQLGRPHSYTEACNIGARLARERGFAFLCVANNDITFCTDVLGELHAAMVADPALGIVAPSQLIRDAERGQEVLSNRVYWDLERVEFQHDLVAPDPAAERLEADFCELTCPLIRMAAVEAVGFLDDEYGFYHEDADFCFRLRRAGYGCAYLPRTQIVHYTSSTFAGAMSARKRDYIARNRRYFVSKHLGYGVRWPGAATPLRETLQRFGLLDAGGRDLVFGRPGDTDGYLFASTEGRLPRRWARHATRARAVLVRSEAERAAFLELGYPHVFTVPLGVDPEVFHPWGARRRADGVTTFLAVCDGWRVEALRPVLEAWHGFARPGVRLVLLGQGLGEVLGQVLGRAPDRGYTTQLAHIGEYAAERVVVHDLLSPMAAGEEAALFRGVDFAVVPGVDGAAGPAALKLGACGVVTVEAAGGFEACLGLDAAGYRALSGQAANRVFATATLRHTAMGLRDALSRVQIREPGAVLARMERRAREEEPERVAGGSAPDRAGRAAAQRVVTAGRLATQFGTRWQEEGLRVAGRAVARELGYFLSSRRRAVIPAAPRVQSGAALDPAVLLIGYVDAQLGLGQSSRGMARAMAAAGVAFRTRPIAAGVEGRRTVPFMPERVDLVGAYAVNVIETTVDELPAVLAEAGEGRVRDSYNILRTYWELGRAPEAWRERMAPIHEIWAPNGFVADSFRGVFDGPITVVPPCLDVPEAEPGGHEEFGLEPGRFQFLFSFDYFSFPQRKNPLGVVRAFCRAFPDPATRVGLVMKAAGSPDHHPAVKQALRRAASHDERIQVVDETLSRAEMLALMTACDCYVSLHRAEGFGLGMAEAMALGKPVVATDYSGSTDFLSPATGYPVPAALRALAEGDYLHAADQVWAEPDEAAAAAAMRRVFEHPDEAAAKGRAARDFVLDRYGPAQVGGQVAARLAAIRAGGAGR